VDILNILVGISAILAVGSLVLKIVVLLLETRFTILERETLRTSSKDDMKFLIILGGIIAIGFIIYYGIYFAFINLDMSVLTFIIHMIAVWLTYLFFVIFIRTLRHFIKLLLNIINS